MKLVKFRDGTYGVRKGFWPFYMFKDFRASRFWWTADSEYFHDCKTEDIETARRASNPDYGEVVD